MRSFAIGKWRRLPHGRPHGQSLSLRSSSGCPRSTCSGVYSSFRQPIQLSSSDVRPSFPSRRQSWSNGRSTFKRSVHLETILLPPVVFTGLLCALWTWKCMMMVVFQNKIIYMPGLPPNARREEINSYSRQCRGVAWREESITASDGTRLALCVADRGSPKIPESKSAEGEPRRHSEVPVYILYLQGNASSMPPRLPDLSSVLQALPTSIRDAARVRYTMVCLSYRGYWKSRGRPSEKGINLDTLAALHWIAQEHNASHSDPTGIPRPVILVWGQSIGAGFATNLAASTASPKIDGLLLETPFLSLRDMLAALYPQRWVPYRHLWPFLRNQLDNRSNVDRIVSTYHAAGLSPPSVFVLDASKDELVPPDHAPLLVEQCKTAGMLVARKPVSGAYHNDAVVRVEGKRAMVDAIEREVRRAALS